MKGWIKGKSMACNAGAKQKSNVENIPKSDNHDSFNLYFKIIFLPKITKYFESITLCFLTKFLGDKEELWLK